MKEYDADLVARLLRLVLVMLKVVEGKNVSIKKLKRLVFGKGSEKHSKPLARQEEGGSKPAQSDNETQDDTSTSRARGF